LNNEARGDAPSFRRLLDDIAEYIGTLAAGGRPVFLIAISWGGKLGLALQRRHPGLIDGLALLCPGIISRIRPSFRERCRIAATRLFAPRALFPIPLNEPALFTASPKWQQFILDDPLSLRMATARLLVESARLDAYQRWARRAVTLPLLLLLAEHDRIIDTVRTREFIERLPSPEKRIIEYHGASHTLEFEPDPGVFVTDLCHWLDERCAVALANRKHDR
jgi:alpha-beta hydrolase superfamily lysophospholipase